MDESTGSKERAGLVEEAVAVAERDQSFDDLVGELRGAAAPCVELGDGGGVVGGEAFVKQVEGDVWLREVAKVEVVGLQSLAEGFEEVAVKGAGSQICSE